VHKDAGGTADNVYTVFPLEIPNASNIRRVQEYLDNGNKFNTEIGSLKPNDNHNYVPLREALWVCSQEFHSKSQAKKVNEYRRVWLFTNDDSPNGNAAAEQEKIIKVAKDCAETGIEISLWHMNPKPGQEFSPSAFYENLLQATNIVDSKTEDEEEAIGVEHRMRGGGDEGFDIMLASVRRKHHRKRKLRSMTMSFGREHPAENYAAVTLYRLISLTKKSLHKWLYSKTNEPLSIMSKFINGETGETLDESSITTYLDVAGARIEFSAEDMKTIKSCGALNTENKGPAAVSTAKTQAETDAGADIVLLYCTPISTLTPDANVECAYFLFPDNSTVSGSTPIFAALLATLLDRQLVAMVRFRRTKNGAPRLACMIPQPEVLDEDGVQIQPPGFNVIVLPFMEEIRRNPSAAGCVPEVLEPTQDAEGELVQAARNLIRAAKLDDSFEYYRSIENPALQQFHRCALGFLVGFL
jgi:ATP-dependent DNA helicase 2 subunit 1